MHSAVQMVKVMRGDFEESVHFGHAVVADARGGVIESWGDISRMTLPRSSSKILQAIPLIESGAAYKYYLNSEHLALACASHDGALIHTNIVQEWLKDIEKSDSDLRCGPQMPNDNIASSVLIKDNKKPCQFHNNCSGKHTGFLTLSKFLCGGSDYHALDHPVQQTVKECFEEMTNTSNAGHAIDGCSAPNFACTLVGLAQAMATIAEANEISSSSRVKASFKLLEAMINHPDLVAGEGRACTDLMRASNKRVVVKTGAEAVFIAILPELKLGIALKIEDGSTRASEAVIAELLARYGVLDRNHPLVRKRLQGPITNWNGIETGEYRVCFD